LLTGSVATGRVDGSGLDPIAGIEQQYRLVSSEGVVVDGRSVNARGHTPSSTITTVITTPLRRARIAVPNRYAPMGHLASFS